MVHSLTIHPMQRQATEFAHAQAQFPDIIDDGLQTDESFNGFIGALQMIVGFNMFIRIRVTASFN